MTDYGNKHQKNKDKIPASIQTSESWRAIANLSEEYEEKEANKNLIFTGRILQGGNFSGENLEGADFSGSNMQEIILKDANLRNVNFTGADLSGADLSGSMLDGAVFTGAKLIGTNFTGAHMHGVTLKNADLQDAILLDADLDNLSLEELQELVEYLATYYPHKLNLSRLNLTMLDLKRIDLRKVNLRGVDFTGCNFFGVNIYELDLSECIISPAQIEQAIGHIPTMEEMKKIMAPKKKKAKSKMNGIDLEQLFHGGNGSFEFDATKANINVSTMVKKGKEFVSKFKKPDSDEKIIENYNKKREQKETKEPKESSNDELRKSIEQYKREVLERRQEERTNKNKETPVIVNTNKGNER